MNFINEGVNKFVKFGLVGVLNTLINWIIFALLNFIGVYSAAIFMQIYTP